MFAFSSGSVSDLFMRVLMGGTLVSADSNRECECFLFVVGGEGSRVDGSSDDGSLLCDLDVGTFVVFLARVGNGRLLNVRLLGIPPMGSSGRQM